MKAEKMIVSECRREESGEAGILSCVLESSFPPALYILLLLERVWDRFTRWRHSPTFKMWWKFLVLCFEAGSWVA